MAEEEKERVLTLQDRYGIRGTDWNIVTIRVTKWFYHGPRVKLTIVEGSHDSKNIDKAIASYGKHPEFHDYPKNLEIICRPEEMLELAKTIVEVCKS